MKIFSSKTECGVGIVPNRSGQTSCLNRASPPFVWLPTDANFTNPFCDWCQSQASTRLLRDTFGSMIGRLSWELAWMCFFRNNFTLHLRSLSLYHEIGQLHTTARSASQMSKKLHCIYEDRYNKSKYLQDPVGKKWGHVQWAVSTHIDCRKSASCLGVVVQVVSHGFLLRG